MPASAAACGWWITLFSAVYALAWLFLGWAISLRDWLMTTLTTNEWFLVPAFVAIFGGISFAHQPSARLLQWICPAASLWTIQSDAQRLDH